VDLSRLFEWRYWKAFTELEIWLFLLDGLRVTVTIAAAAILLSLVFGTLLAIARINRFPLIRYPAALYIEIVRALPVLFLIFFTYFGGARGITILGLKLSWEDPVAAAIIALTAYTSAVNAEIIRAGILSIERGQLEAARALGLSYVQMMRLVVLPQALRRMVPPQISQFITLIKDTSLVYVIGAHELLNKAKILYSGFETGPIQALLVAGSIYLLINYALSRLSRRLEIGAADEVGAERGAVAGPTGVAPRRACAARGGAVRAGPPAPR
jgi:putative glutamine transport system permease protein